MYVAATWLVIELGDWVTETLQPANHAHLVRFRGHAGDVAGNCLVRL